MPGLGRHVQHDPRSWDFPASKVDLRTCGWAHLGPVLDQGDVGSCTGNAMAQLLNTEWYVDEHGGRLLTEADAVAIYSWATHHDRIRGVYPPHDTGSSGLAVCKAAQRLGLISGYHHAFGLAHTLCALAAGPVLIGIPWLETMFQPLDDGTLVCEGEVAGGHEVVLTGLNVELQRVTLLNSWGPSWGREGVAFLAWDDLGRLLADQGDCTVPHL